MSKKLTRRVTTKHKVKIPDNRPLPEPVESMVAPVLVHPVHHEHHETHHPFGPKISPFSMAEISNALPTTKSSAIYSQSSNMSRTESRNASRSTFCSGYNSADGSGTFIGLHDLGSDINESGTSFLSWSDDSDNDTTKKLQDMFDGLEKFLYGEAEFPSNAGKDLLEECLIWKDTFTYKRPAVAPPPREEAASKQRETAQEALATKVKDLVMENLSSVLLSRVLTVVVTDIAQARDRSEQLESQRRARSRSASPQARPNRMPALVHKPPRPSELDHVVPIHEAVSKRAAIDRCFGSGVGVREPSLSRPLPHRHLSLQPVRLPQPSADSALGLSLAGRKSPRQEAILRSLQEERRKHSGRGPEQRDDPRIPSSHKPPWIGFANITLPPIVDVAPPAVRSDRKRSSSRGRKVSPPGPKGPVSRGLSPVPFGGGLTRLNAAKKLVEQMPQPNPTAGVSRKAKKYLVN